MECDPPKCSIEGSFLTKIGGFGGAGTRTVLNNRERVVEESTEIFVGGVKEGKGLEKMHLERYKHRRKEGVRN